MFTGSVIDTFFGKKESLLAVRHYMIEGKVLLLKIVYVRLSIFTVLKRGIFLTVSVPLKFIYDQQRSSKETNNVSRKKIYNVDFFS